MIRHQCAGSECEAGAEHHEPGWASPKGQGQDGPGNNGSGQPIGGSALKPALPGYGG